MQKKCIWCLEEEPSVNFFKKAHTIPKSLGGQNYNKFVCDSCNAFFGQTMPVNQYSIEEALKETFCISRQRFLNDMPTKRKIGAFKSKFFEVKFRDGKPRLSINPTFMFKEEFQSRLCRSFKRGLVKMWFEEFDRQSGYREGHYHEYKILRDFARYDIGNIPILYFNRQHGIFLMTKREAETPILILNRMNYLYHNEKFTEIEFLGHVFGFPISDYSLQEYNAYIKNSIAIKQDYFSSAIVIGKLTDIDFTLRLLDK